MDATDRVFDNVKHGDVDYEALSRDDLDEALRRIAAADLKTLRGNARYAFLINAYNLAVLDAVRRVLRRPGKRGRSLRNLWTRFRFFFLTPVRIAGRRMSLFWLEFRLIKWHLRRDPRGHFALVCAAKGCPPLRDGVFHGETLDEELDLAGRVFNQDGAGYRLDRDDGVLHLSRIYKWYRRDFRALGGLIEAWATHAPAADVEWVRLHTPRVRFMRYDWDLNIAKD